MQASKTLATAAQISQNLVATLPQSALDLEGRGVNRMQTPFAHSQELLCEVVPTQSAPVETFMHEAVVKLSPKLMVSEWGRARQCDPRNSSTDFTEPSSAFVSISTCSQGRRCQQNAKAKYSPLRGPRETTRLYRVTRQHLLTLIFCPNLLGQLQTWQNKDRRA